MFSVTDDNIAGIDVAKESFQAAILDANEATLHNGSFAYNDQGIRGARHRKQENRRAVALRSHPPGSPQAGGDAPIIPPAWG